MPVAIADTTRRWPTGSITYNPRPEGSGVTAENLKEWVGLFNAQVGYPIWIASTEQFDITFVFGEQSESALGKARSDGRQKVAVKVKGGHDPKRSIFHEMCHAIGLAHENFHTGYPYRSQLLQKTNQIQGQQTKSIEDDRLLSIVNKLNLYIDIGPYNPNSIMLYGAGSFGLSGISYPLNKQELHLSDGDKDGIRFLIPFLRPQSGSLTRKWCC